MAVGVAAVVDQVVQRVCHVASAAACRTRRSCRRCPGRGSGHRPVRRPVCGSALPLRAEVVLTGTDAA